VIASIARAVCVAAVVIVWVAHAPCLAAAGPEAKDQEKKDSALYQPMGAPADPKVPAQWNRYRDYAEATKLLQAMAAAHPKRAKLQSLGRSCGGREMWVLTITSFERGDDRQKPAFWIDGAIHANEIQAVEVALYTGWYLLEMYGRTPFVTRLVDERTIYILPMMSPDSRDAHMARPNSTHSPRSGQRPVDDDRDGRVDEDGPDDLDGDGNIAQMRVRDPNGRWKPHPDFPRVMVAAKPDERGEYRLLGEEGYDNDGDGRVNEDGDGYYDPNRNWPWDWQPEHVQGGAHHYPLSILENRMAADFITDHPNIAGAQSYHNAGGMILRGPGMKEESYEPGDVAVFDAIARKGEMVLPGYRYLNVGRDLYPMRGGELDWLYTMRGVFAYTNELFPSYNLFRKTTDGGWLGKDEEKAAFNKYLLLDQGAVPWKEVVHPQFGRVEVGGLKKSWGRQPPSFLLEEECHRNMAFTLYHADQLPQVTVQSVAARPVGGGVVEVTAVVANTRMIPTHAAIDLKNAITPPDLVTIEGRNKDLKVVAGLLDESPFFLNARPQKRHPETIRVPNVPGMGAVYVRWLVRGEGPYTVGVRSVRGGSDRWASGS
jgi:hypothetical protein